MTAQIPRGFSLVEIIIAISLLGIISISLFGVGLHFYSEVVASNRQTSMSLEAQTAIRKVSDDLRMSSGINPSNITADPSRPSGWITGVDNVIVISVPATDASRNFIINSATNNPYRNEIIYFSSGSTLYRRTLPNPAASGNAMLRSCPEATASSVCPADTILTSKLSSTVYTFYDELGDETFTYSSSRSVKITIHVEDEVYDSRTAASHSTRIVMRNA